MKLPAFITINLFGHPVDRSEAHGADGKIFEQEGNLLAPRETSGEMQSLIARDRDATTGDAVLGRLVAEGWVQVTGGLATTVRSVFRRRGSGATGSSGMTRLMDKLAAPGELDSLVTSDFVARKGRDSLDKDVLALDEFYAMRPDDLLGAQDVYDTLSVRDLDMLAARWHPNH